MIRLVYFRDDLHESKVIRRRFVNLAFFLSIIVLFSACSSTTKYNVVNDEWITLEGKVGIRFDIGGDMYRLLPEESESLLIDNYILEKSENIIVKDPHISVTLEDVKENKGDSTVSYKMYYIKVKIDAMVSEGDNQEVHGIRLSFPAVLEVRNALKAISPTQEPSITFSIRGFSSRKDLASKQWWKQAAYAIGLVIVTIIALAITEGEGGCALIALGTAIVSVYFWFLTLRNIWIISPIISIIVGITVVVGFVQFIRAKSK